MNWNFDDNRAIYSQIIEQIQLFIVSGNLQPGEKITSVRELAQEAGVNPNTMQRALSELEGQGLLFSNRTSGRFVTEDVSLISEIKKKVANEKIKEFLTHMNAIGYSKEEITKIITQIGDDSNE